MFHELLLSGEVRAALVLALGLGAYGLLSRAAAATRRFVLVLTLGAALVVPLAAALLPRWTVEAPAALSAFGRESPNETARAMGAVQDAAAPAPAIEGRAVSVFSAPVAVSGVLALAWLVVAAALLGRAGASQLRARALVRRARRVETAAWGEAVRQVAPDPRVQVRASSEIDSPAVVGLLRPTIVVPRGAIDWPLERCKLVLVHELAHVRRRDVMVQAVADAACALHWCNPLVWIAARRLRVEREMAADDVVLAAGVRPSRYAEELVAVATAVAAPHAALAMAERSSLEARIASILAARPARAPLAARGTAAVIVAGALLAVVTACLSPEMAAAVPETGGLAPRAGTANDPLIQRVADEELDAMQAHWAAERATIVVLDPATGAILANAGRTGGRRSEIASTVAVAPGSTIKPITVAAALEARAITADQRFECGPLPRRYGDRELHDAAPNGTLDVAHLLAVSSNVGMSRIFDALGGEAFTAWLRRFHFGAPSAIPGATTGTFPAQVRTGTLEGAIVAIGHRMTATPLQMIAAYGALAADGVYHAPSLERGGSVGERILSIGTARTVMGMLETAVVDATGTGRAARVDGVHVAGKTGTADWTAPDGRDRTYASFVGVADLPARRLVVLVGIQAARDDISGGNSAAPVFARVVTRLR